MKHFTTELGEFIAVPLPQNAIIDLYWVNRDSEIIGRTSDILKDEELAKKVVIDWFEDHTESFQSLLKANDLTGTTYLIIKKLNQ